MSKARGLLYRLARLLGDLEAIGLGKRKRVQRRAKNKVAGRLMGKVGIWGRLWR